MCWRCFGTRALLSLTCRSPPLCAPLRLALSLPTGQEDYDRVRPLSYPGTNVFLFCFSLIKCVCGEARVCACAAPLLTLPPAPSPHSPSSFENLKSKWFAEVRHHMPSAPFVIVGTKMDLRANAEVIARLRAEGRAPVTTADGERLAEELGAARYLECSALTQQGLKSVFDEAIRVALEVREKPAKVTRKSRCSIA